MTKNTLIKSTSGIRGIIGQGLDPILVTQFAAAFGTFLKKGKVVIGRDSRPSGDMFLRSVAAGLAAVGRDVVDIGVVPTPTVAIAVKKLHAVGGVCVTASHNPAMWNALKLFNRTGEFIGPTEFRQFNRVMEKSRFDLQPADKLGQITSQDGWIDEHIKIVLAAPGVSRRAIRNRGFKVVVDAINGAGSSALPEMLERMGVEVVRVNCDGDGKFVHEPEPIPKNLRQLGRAVKKHAADLGLACDPDADRLALVDENGRAIGEELTLAIAIMPVLAQKTGVTVFNLSTSSVTADVARSFGSKVYLSKVGEANVVQMIHQKRAVIGGEGNGGVIYPACHTGRDSLVAAALVLTALCRRRISLAQMVETLPVYHAIKTKAPLTPRFDRQLDGFGRQAAKLLGKIRVNRQDGLRFDFERGWLQIRTSNTEPIYRLIVETDDKKLTRQLVDQVSRYFK